MKTIILSFCFFVICQCHVFAQAPVYPAVDTIVKIKKVCFPEKWGRIKRLLGKTDNSTAAGISQLPKMDPVAVSPGFGQQYKLPNLDNYADQIIDLLLNDKRFMSQVSPKVNYERLANQMIHDEKYLALLVREMQLEWQGTIEFKPER